MFPAEIVDKSGSFYDVAFWNHDTWTESRVAKDSVLAIGPAIRICGGTAFQGETWGPKHFACHAPSNLNVAFELSLEDGNCFLESPGPN